MPAALRVAIPLSAGNLGFGAYLRFALSREFYLREKDFSEMRSPHVTSKCNERRNYHRNRQGLGERKTPMHLELFRQIKYLLVLYSTLMSTEAFPCHPEL